MKNYACQGASDPDVFMVTSQQGKWSDGEQACRNEFAGARFSVPQNAFQNGKLQSLAGGKSVWLNFSDRRVEGEWRR